jgi:hypothetical protein
MKNKLILTLALLASTAYAENNTDDITIEYKNDIDTDDFSKPTDNIIDLKNDLNNNNILEIFIGSNSSNLYEGLKHNWNNISQAFGNIFFSDILPFALQMRELQSLLKQNEDFQKLVQKNVNKFIKLALPLFKELTDEAARIAGAEEVKEIELETADYEEN